MGVFRRKVHLIACARSPISAVVPGVGKILRPRRKENDHRMGSL